MTRGEKFFKIISDSGRGSYPNNPAECNRLEIEVLGALNQYLGTIRIPRHKLEEWFRDMNDKTNVHVTVRK